jgi:hypothetical protein
MWFLFREEGGREKIPNTHRTNCDEKNVWRFPVPGSGVSAFQESSEFYKSGVATEIVEGRTNINLITYILS